MPDVQCKEVIVSEILRRGEGIYRDPVRIITQVFEKDGTLIAEYDPVQNNLEYSSVDMAEFAMYSIKNKIEPDKIDISTVREWWNKFKDVKP